MSELNSCPCCNSDKYPLAQIHLNVAKDGSRGGYSTYQTTMRVVCLDCLLFAFNCVQAEHASVESNVKLLARLDERCLNLANEAKAKAKAEAERAAYS